MELLSLNGIDDRRYVASSWGQPAHVRRSLKLNSPLPGQPSDGECAFHRSPLLYLFKYNMYMAAREKPLIWGCTPKPPKFLNGAELFVTY